MAITLILLLNLSIRSNFYNTDVLAEVHSIYAPEIFMCLIAGASLIVTGLMVLACALPRTRNTLAKIELDFLFHLVMCALLVASGIWLIHNRREERDYFVFDRKQEDEAFAAGVRDFDSILSSLTPIDLI